MTTELKIQAFRASRNQVSATSLWREYRFAIIQALALNIALLSVFVLNWSSEHDTPRVKAPEFVRAVLLERPVPAKPRPVVRRPRPVVTPPKPVVTPPKPVPARPAPVVKPPEPVVDPEPIVEPVVEPIVEIDFSDMLEDEDEQIAQEEQSRALALAEQASREASEVAQFSEAIKQQVKRKWSRPPSARNGMQALFRIHLIPGGEVIDVALIESSGDVTVDRSAETAIRLASPLPVPTDVALFNKSFRQFLFRFKPEDLRQ